MGKLDNAEKDLKIATKLIDSLGSRQLIVLFVLVIGWVFIQRPIDKAQTESDLMQARNDSAQTEILENIMDRLPHLATKNDITLSAFGIKKEVKIEIVESERRVTQNQINSLRTDDKTNEIKRLQDFMIEMDTKIEHILRNDPKNKRLLNQVIEDTTMALTKRDKVNN